MRRVGRILAATFVAAVLALFTIDLRHRDSKPRVDVIANVEGHGELRAGFGHAEIHVPYPVVPAGYGPLDRHEVWGAAQPQMARAISLQVGDAKLTLVSVDLLEIDSRLLDDLRPRLPKDAGEIWVCATHTHSGMGNYDPNLLAEIAGTGRFKPAAREALLDAIARAIGDTRDRDVIQLGEVTTGRAQVFDRSSSTDAPDETVTRFDFAVGSPVRFVEPMFVLGAHPTTINKPVTLNEDFPSFLATFFQGAGGNVSVTAPWTRDTARGARSSLGERNVPVDSMQLSGLTLGAAPVEFHAGPKWTRRASANLVDRLAAPRTMQLSVAELGPLTFVAIPGEPTSAAGRAIREALGKPDAIVMGLCNGYVGYIETPDRVEKEVGEAPRQYFDASLLARITSALASGTSHQPPATSH